MKPRERYHYVDAALLHASVSTGEVIPRPWPNLDIDTDVEPWCTWIERVWAQSRVAEAIAVASPVLASRVEALRDGLRPDATQVRHMVLSLARYLVRMRGRATPFGLFAGVVPIRFGKATAIQWTRAHHRSVRPDAVWLASVIARLESYPTLRRRLRVVMNDLAVVRGDRLVVTWQPHASELGYQRTAEVSVRHTPPVRMVQSLACSPIRVADLVGKVAAEFPNTEWQTVDAVVAELIARGALITALRPPLTAVDGLGHVLEALQDADASTVPEAAPLIGELRAIHAGLQATDRSASPMVEHRPQTVTVERMRALSNTTIQPLMVDLGLGGTVVLPRQVAVEAASAAGALLRLSAAPTGVPAWQEYHGRFLDRYGPGAVVPVTQLVDPTAGLGFPCHYIDPDRNGVAAGWSRRDERLLALAQQAALDGVQEVVLDDAVIDALAGGEVGELRPAPHLDLCVEVRAATTAALDAGEFTVVATGIGHSAIATSGRFLQMLFGEDRQRIVGQYRAPPLGVDGALAAQVSFPPRHPRVENITRVPQVLPAVISVAEHRDGHADEIGVPDLAVTADQKRMYVLSLSRRRVVEPTLTCAAAWHTMPPLARLLVEIPQATCAPVALFDWGAAACLPFRPRLRYRRSILTPARWRIPVGALPGLAAPRHAWAAAMAVLRRKLRLPVSVFVGTADRRLRLNLDDPMDLALLRAHLDTASESVTVTEAPTAADHGWCHGRAHEVVIPMASTAAPAGVPAVVSRPGPLPLIDPEHGLMPGSPVLFAKLYGNPDAFDTILTKHLPVLLGGWDEAPLWWFVRYRDPAPHLRIRLRTPDYGASAARVGVWAADLRRCGLVGDLTLHTYRPETARYGGGAAMAAAEALFAADSTAAVAQLAALTGTRGVHPHALTAVSLADLACAVLGSRPAGMRWLIDHADLAARVAIRDRDVLRQAVTLADLDTASPTLPTVPNSSGVVAAWHARRQAATTYARCLAENPGHTDPATVAVSLLHLHHIRAHGADPQTEACTHRLARSIALAYTTRRTAAQGATS
ncbi:MAG: lantibiotic dehydratase [Pseudonocardiales bacterium]|nr:lantibiotic dehydratase [Pseudonocardiales bacterium]